MSVLIFTTCYTKQRKSKEKIKAKNGKTVNLDIMNLCTIALKIVDIGELPWIR